MLMNCLRDIETAQTVEEVWEKSVGVLDAEGVSFVTYVTVAADYTAPVLHTTLPLLYLDHHAARDPFLHHCCTSYEITCTGAAFLEDYQYLPKPAQQFIQKASDLGWRSGLGIPVRLVGSGRFGGVNIGTRLNRDEFEKVVLPRAEEFRLFSLIMHRRLEELMEPDTGDEAVMDVPPLPPLAKLAPREREIVWFLAKGMSRKEIAQACKLSPHTVADYTRQAYRKLGVRNRVEVTRLVVGL